MGKSLSQLIGFTTLLGLVTSPDGGVPDNILPSGFMSLTEPVDGNTAGWNVVANTRQTARTNNYGASAKTRDPKAISSKSGVLIHAFESMRHKMTTLMNLRAFDDPGRQAKGEQVVAYQTAEFRRTLNNLRVASIYSALARGAIYFDSDGNLLPSSSGASLTIDLGISANHKNQLNSLVTGKWDNSASDIIGDIGRIRAQSRKDTGKTLKYAFYGSAIPGYLMGNAGVQKLLPGSQRLSESLMSGDIPAGFGSSENSGDKLIWVPIREAFFNDNDGTDQDLVPSDFVIFTPEPTPDWYRLLEGSFPVPTSLSLVADAEEALNSFSEQHGMFSYAQVGTNPPAIDHFAGDTFLPTFLQDAIFQLDTVW